jgi:uncharacterized protein (TIRG00374 family)
MKNKKLNLILSIFLGIIFLIIWLKIIDWQEFINYLKNFNLKLVLVFSVFYLLAYFLRSLRWKIILKPIYEMKVIESSSIFMTGLVINYLIPVRAGELAKSIILKNKHKIPISQSLPSIFIDKLADLFPIVIILVLIPLISIRSNYYLYAVILLLFLIFMLFLGFLFFSTNHKEKAVNILNFFLKIFPVKFREKLSGFILNFVNGMTIMKNRFPETILATLITLLAVFSEAIYIWVLFKAFGAQISYFKILFGYTLMNLTYILPTPPAQIGSNQFMWVLIFSFALGVNENLTSAAVTFSHLLTTVLIFFVGMFSLFALKIRFTDILKLKK